MEYVNKKFSHEKVNKTRKYTTIHSHDSHELYFLINGSTKYFIKDEIFQLNKGNFIFIPKNTIHRTDTENCFFNERILLTFGDEIFDSETIKILEDLSSEKLICIPPNKITKLEKLLYAIEEEYMSGNKYESSMIDLYIRQLLILLSRYKLPKNQNVYNSDDLIYQISEYISSNAGGNITLNSLAKKFAFSPEHLSRKFKATLGVGVNEYIRYIRILNAEKLLTGTNLSITEISEKCGFNDSNYFSTVFKKTLGLSPYQYKKTQLNTRL